MYSEIREVFGGLGGQGGFGCEQRERGFLRGKRRKMQNKGGKSFWGNEMGKMTI